MLTIALPNESLTLTHFLEWGNGGPEWLWDWPRLQSLLAVRIKSSSLNSSFQASRNVVPSVSLTHQSYTDIEIKGSFFLQRDNVLCWYQSLTLKHKLASQNLFLVKRSVERMDFFKGQEWGVKLTHANLRKWQMGQEDKKALKERIHRAVRWQVLGSSHVCDVEQVGQPLCLSSLFVKES